MPVNFVTCNDCNSSEFGTFMLKDDIWSSIAAMKDYLCIQCVEERLGRKVTLYDLKPCFWTYAMFLGAYIGSNTPELPKKEVLINAESFTEGQRKFIF